MSNKFARPIEEKCQLFKGPNNSTIVMFQSVLYSHHPCNVRILHGSPLISIPDLPMMHNRRNKIIIGLLLARIIILGGFQGKSHVFGFALIVILRFNLTVQSRKHRNSKLGENTLARVKVRDDVDIQIPIKRCTRKKIEIRLIANLLVESSSVARVK